MISMLQYSEREIMSYGTPKYFPTSLTCGVTLGSAVDLGASYAMYAIEIPTMTSATDVAIQGCATASGTYRRVYVMGTGSTAANTISSATTNAIVPLRVPLPQFVRVELTTAMTATPAAFKILCWN